MQVECLSKLAPVRFGVYSSAERIVSAIRIEHAAGRPITERQAIALYKTCWRFRGQIGDWKFMARVLIAKELLEEVMDVAAIVGTKVYARAWRAPPAQSGLDL